MLSDQAVDFSYILTPQLHTSQGRVQRLPPSPLDCCNMEQSFEGPAHILSLFSGIAGIEQGFESAGFTGTVEFCERWEPARRVLKDQYAGAFIRQDVTDIQAGDIPEKSLVTAGFPCTDLSQAGRTMGLKGEASSLILHVLDVLENAAPDWVLLENVPNMVHLGHGDAIRTITNRLQNGGYNWAYRTIDSRSFGLAQRRRRVYLLASRKHDPSRVLFRTNMPTHVEFDGQESDAFGFAWTEGNRGMGWCQDAVPTLKGSTTISVPSAPAIWRVDAPVGHSIVTPSIEAAEVMQGFRAGWTKSAPVRDRWKLVGNAVSVPVARWIAEGIAGYRSLGAHLLEASVLEVDGRWPKAAHNGGGETVKIEATEWPEAPGENRDHLNTILDTYGSTSLSFRATRGFRDRLKKSPLKRREEFVNALDAHVDYMASST